MSNVFDEACQELNRNRHPYANRDVIEGLQRFTAARIAVGKAGPRPLTGELLRFRVDHAAARDAIADTVPDELLQKWNCVPVRTQAETREEYLLRPDKGRRLLASDRPGIQQPEFQSQAVLVLVGDGLSATSIQHNLDDILPSLQVSLRRYEMTMPRPIFIRHARVALMDEIGELLKPETVIYLIGERPGLQTGNGMSAYLCYKPSMTTIESDREVISNIHHAGLSPLEAGAIIAERIAGYRDKKSSGIPR